VAQKAKSMTQEQILAWADTHYARTGMWPTTRAGLVLGAPGENWQAINQALVRGHRGLPGDSSLAQLLAERRGERNPCRLTRLTVQQILVWAKAHRERTGQWPNRASGPVTDALGETWVNIDGALWQGHRGLSGGDSLARLLNRHRPRDEQPKRRWTAKEDQMVRTLPVREVARRTGRSLTAVYMRRRVLGAGTPLSTRPRQS
jgi:hypothetical protein